MKWVLRCGEGVPGKKRKCEGGERRLRWRLGRRHTDITPKIRSLKDLDAEILLYLPNDLDRVV